MKRIFPWITLFVLLSTSFVPPLAANQTASAQSNDCYWKLTEEIPTSSTSSTAEGATAHIEGTSLYVSYQGLNTTHTWTALPQTLVPGEEINIEISVSWDFDKSSSSDPVSGVKTSLIYDYTKRLETGNSHVVFRTNPRDYLSESLTYTVFTGSIGQELYFTFLGDAAVGFGSYRYTYLYVCPETIEPVELQYGVWAVSYMSGSVDAYYPVGKDKDGNYVYDLDEPHSVKDGMELPVGTRIITSDSGNSYVKIWDKVSNSVILLKADTEVDLLGSLPEKPGLLELHWGRLKANIGKVLQGESIEVKSNWATVGIKGTEFILETADENTVIKVIEGEVNFTSLVDNSNLSLQPGELAGADASGLTATTTFDIQQELADWPEMDTVDSLGDLSENPPAEPGVESTPADQEGFPPQPLPRAGLPFIIGILLLILGGLGLILFIILFFARERQKKNADSLIQTTTSTKKPLVLHWIFLALLLLFSCLLSSFGMVGLILNMF